MAQQSKGFQDPSYLARYAQSLGSTAAGTAGQGGVPVPQGAQFWVVSGTDATATTLCTIDYQIAPGAGVTI